MGETVLAEPVNLVFGFAGNRAAADDAEYVKYGTMGIPQGMIGNTIIHLFTGYSMFIAFLYCVPTDDLFATTLSFLFITASHNMINSTAATTAMTRLIVDLYSTWVIMMPGNDAHTNVHWVNDVSHDPEILAQTLIM
ncbi:hypothetical protein K504DRAFT_527268 [Pleomassaria siparia CBS 279.74]|uniref:Uncharacterized protein n=1 Tax=Pleomassaria siparia CBS 279.74 TaxID=1314801 RepID=A0A6G1K9S7_9PLEO|nr:hypothetical protein K504DRAFT_527268 [Pleomassaria siparia CBS 279.74]